MRKIISYLLTGLQFLLLVVFALSGPVLPSGIVSVIFFGAGLFLGIWAIFSIGINNLTVFPLPLKDTTLSREGPYKWIRHPMYTAILLVTIPLTIEYINISRVVVQVLLVIDLLVKVHFEENALSRDVNGYEIYKRYSKKFIPYLY
ncbi:MAG: methyltransferase family protein [Bacteroidales bacterium]